MYRPVEETLTQRFQVRAEELEGVLSSPIFVTYERKVFPGQKIEDIQISYQPNATAYEQKFACRLRDGKYEIAASGMIDIRVARLLRKSLPEHVKKLVPRTARWKSAT